MSNFDLFMSGEVLFFEAGIDIDKPLLPDSYDESDRDFLESQIKCGSFICQHRRQEILQTFPVPPRFFGVDDKVKCSDLGGDVCRVTSHYLAFNGESLYWVYLVDHLWQKFGFPESSLERVHWTVPTWRELEAQQKTDRSTGDRSQS